MSEVFIYGPNIIAGEVDAGQFVAELDGKIIYMRLADDPRTSHKGPRFQPIFRDDPEIGWKGTGSRSFVRFGLWKKLQIVVMSGKAVWAERIACEARSTL